MKKIKLLFSSLLYLGAASIACAQAPTQLPFSACGGISYENLNLTNLSKQVKTEVGSVSVILFSTSWCCHCPFTTEKMMNVAEKLKSKGNIKFYFVLLGNATKCEAEKHFGSTQSNNVTICDPIRSAVSIGIDSVPCCVILNQCGIQVFRYNGRINYDCKDFIGYLEKLSDKASYVIKQPVVSNEKKIKSSTKRRGSRAVHKRCKRRNNENNKKHRSRGGRVR